MRSSNALTAPFATLPTWYSTPIYFAVVRDLAGQEGRDIVRAAFPEPCGTCDETPPAPCRTAGGKVTRRHKARGRA